MKKVISIDGGGIRGVIPGQILVALEERLPKSRRISDYIDFVAGTSTGGILTALLLHPKRYTAKQCVELYIENGSKIFAPQLFGGLFRPKYSVKGIEDCLDKYIGQVKMSQLLKPCIITSYDISRRQTKFFAQHDKVDFFVKDVCRATSAAPTYFKPKLLKDLSGNQYACVDGGVFANNPALCAYSEVRNSKGAPTAKDMFILSLGTGTVYQPYTYAKAKGWGKLGWIEPVIDILMSGPAEITDYNMKMMFSANHNQRNYLRIQPRSLGHASPEMDCVTPANISALERDGRLCAHLRSRQLDKIAEMLLNDKDEVSFD